jgi:hypothetical protein
VLALDPPQLVGVHLSADRGVHRAQRGGGDQGDLQASHGRLTGADAGAELVGEVLGVLAGAQRDEHERGAERVRDRREGAEDGARDGGEEREVVVPVHAPIQQVIQLAHTLDRGEHDQPAALVVVDEVTELVAEEVGAFLGAENVPQRQTDFQDRALPDAVPAGRGVELRADDDLGPRPAELRRDPVDEGVEVRGVVAFQLLCVAVELAEPRPHRDRDADQTEGGQPGERVPPPGDEHPSSGEEDR